MPAETHTVLKFTRLSEHAFPPVKGSEKAAGFDIKSAYDYIVPARGKELVKTDLQIELPSGCYGRVAPRSGLAVKNFIDVGVEGSMSRRAIRELMVTVTHVYSQSQRSYQCVVSLLDRNRISDGGKS
ncbi:Deoxyuridine 5'-triphosphate nucleotidohydrolase [Eumeta japonica]|uniref:Deoxyuridine 5'-triphosphate nucleotidohydrolase n=1 Tax=Eumeta variegata TaxID=151549 RepID=A0A4C1TNK4_EUMVA|nr:Deoxyuridine 5'-triphosphate nucleotidohydrolase [Eumeta japonica]